MFEYLTAEERQFETLEAVKKCVLAMCISSEDVISAMIY